MAWRVHTYTCPTFRVEYPNLWRRTDHEGAQGLRDEADAHLGCRPDRYRLRQHQVLRALHRAAGRHLGGTARGDQEHLRTARNPRGGASALGRRGGRAVRVRGRLPPDS